MNYLTLFFEFFKTGLFAVGGGMATLPFLYDMAERHPDWFTGGEIAAMAVTDAVCRGVHTGSYRCEYGHLCGV